MDDPTFHALEARVHAITRPEPALLKYYCISSLLSGVAWPFILLYLYFRYRTLHYRFDADGVSMGYGVLFRREMHLTYARMQDIHLSQNIVERWLDIGSVTVQTAGGGPGGDLRVVGVRDFEAIRDYLYARMRGVRTDGASTVTPPDSRLLADIRDELRAAALALGARDREERP